ncbi:MAG: PQQ-binding-like beta-propeller repeat protein [Bacteroidetes bacterium]|nr:PQQ-binding-like beta-propeller repeat protein [Bacteroidota bacterium]
MRHIIRLLAICLYTLFVVNIAAAQDPLIWKYNTGERIFATPLVHNNVLYIGNITGNFYAINSVSGEKIWEYKTDHQIRSTAAIDGNVVCFESGNILYGLDLQGNLLWQDTLCEGPVTEQFDDYDYFHSSPRIVDGIAYIGTEKDKVYGINVQTGAVEFQCQTQKTDNGIRVRPAVHNNKIYFGDWDGVLFVYDLITGQKVWEYDTFPERSWTGGLPSITTSPVVYNGSVYFAGRNCRLLALDAETGAKQRDWLEPNLWLVGGPTIEDTLLALGSSNQRVIRVFNTNTFKLLWEFHVDGRVFCNPLINGDYVYIGTGVEPADNTGSIYVINKKTGEAKNIYTVGAMVHSSPVIADTVLYFGSADGCIYSLGKQTLLNKSFSETGFDKSQSGALGNITSDTSFIVTILNTGDIADTVVMGISDPSLINAITFEPAYFLLQPNTSQNVIFTIKASQLPAKRYNASLQAVSSCNLLSKTISKLIMFMVIKTTDVESGENLLPSYFSLSQNYPNPFNPTTVISYTVPAVGTSFMKSISLKIYDLLGREIAVLVNEQKPAGTYTIEWNGKNSKGQPVGSGMYYYRLQAGQYTETKKMILVK